MVASMMENGKITKGKILNYIKLDLLLIITKLSI
jgi:hypothetical protein